VPYGERLLVVPYGERLLVVPYGERLLPAAACSSLLSLQAE
jgi:hypothetical protein